MLRDIDFSVVYTSGEREPADFFLDALCNSIKYDLALGFFSSSGFRALALGFAYFISNGGVMRVIMNNVLHPQDKNAIEKGYHSKPDELIQDDFTDNIEKLYSRLSRYDRHFFNCISWLIATHRLDLLAITPVGDSSGIAHQKFGVFVDDENSKVAFNGSINFSTHAIFSNMETLSCYKSWDTGISDIRRVKYFEKTFNDIWCGKNKNVRPVPIERVRTYIRSRFDIQDIGYLLDEEEVLLEESIQRQFICGERAIVYRNKLEELKKKLRTDSKTLKEPQLPDNIQLRDYQMQAYTNWESSGCVGLFEMATGTGKTLTALNCAIELYKKEGNLKLLVLVPTLPLSNQWKEEAQKLRLRNIVMINSKNSEWQNEIMHLINLDFASPTDFCLISTYASFSTPQFNSIISKLSKKTLLIADEAHNFGTERRIKSYPGKFERRIGLTATPTRYFDEEGTQAILEFFNAANESTFRLDMGTAIEKGLLCQYYYYPRIVFLTSEELSLYKSISSKLVKYFNFTTERLREDSIVTALLLKRKRIVNQAVGKLDCLRQILGELSDRYKPLRYTFVYVPEGNANIYGFPKTRIIDAYAKIISQEFGLRQHQFIGSTKDRGTILGEFAKGELSVLTAMKCLDEGIDVKRAEIAIFSASTGNPRQFIQRRGRILRTHPEKHHATIYDMIVVPSQSLGHFSESLKIEQNLFRKELKRVAEFAGLSMNKYESLNSLQSIASEYGIDIYSAEYL